MDKHSKWPIFMRMHGSITPKMIMPMVWVAAWSTLITCISHFVHDRECLLLSYLCEEVVRTKLTCGLL